MPQGSHLGPFLFTLFINDIKQIITTEFLLFADDIKIFNSISSTQDQDKLQACLDSICCWCAHNAMDLNESKCQVMTFSRSKITLTCDYRVNGTNLAVVNKVRDLGVILTPKLSPYEHIIHITSKASSMLGFIFRTTKDLRDPGTLVILYKALVRPLLEYCSVV